MSKYTVRLDQLHSSFMRDKDQDDLNMVVLRVMVDGKVIPPQSAPADGSLGNPVVGQLASGVHSGDTIFFRDFTPENAAAWEFSFDGNVPDDSIIQILITVVNTHGQSDPAALRELIKIVLAAGGGAVGGAGTAQAAQIILGAIGAALGTALGDELSNLFAGSPPQCQGMVFGTNFPLTFGLLKRLPYVDATPPDAAPGVAVGQWSNTIPSDPITDAKPECGHPPDYQLTYSILREDEQFIGTFGGTGVGTQSFVPVLNRDLNQWVGDWAYQFVPSEIPRMTCRISLSDTRAGLHVQLVEHFNTWNGVELVSFDLDGLVPQAADHILYSGDVLPGARKLYTHPVIGQLAAIAAMKQQFGKKAGNPALEIHAASSPILAKSLDSRLVASQRLPASSANVLDLPLGKPALSGFLAAGVQALVPLFVDRADTIVIPGKNVVLCLYAHLQNNQEIGRVVRYIRDANVSYTQTDVMLFPPLELH